MPRYPRDVRCPPTWQRRLSLPGSTRLSAIGRDVRLPRRAAWLVIVWGCIGIADAVTFRHSVWALGFALALGASVTLFAVALGLPEIHPWLPLAIVVLTAISAPVYVEPDPRRATFALVGLVLMATALVVMVAGLIVPFFAERHRQVFVVITLAAISSYVFVIMASPNPRNDVWLELQVATKTLVHGHNFYTARWTTGLPGNVSNGFTYLPGSVLLLAPFRAVFGDVRYGLAAAAAVAACCTYGISRSSRRWLPAALVLLFPKADYAIGFGWNDILLVTGIAATIWAVTRHRLGWAVVFLALTLSVKQYAWLFLPLAALWPEFGWKRAAWAGAGALALVLPWAVADFPAFWRGAVSYLWHLPPRLDSPSLYGLFVRLHVNLGAGLGIVTTLLALAAAACLPRTAFGFACGCALAMAGFDLGSEQSLFNQWELVAQLAAIAIAALGPVGDESFGFVTAAKHIGRLSDLVGSRRPGTTPVRQG